VYIPFSTRLVVGRLGLGLGLGHAGDAAWFSLQCCCGFGVRQQRGYGEASSRFGTAFSDIYGGFPVSAGGGGIRLLPGSGCKVEVALLQSNNFLRPFLHFVVSCSGTVDGSVRWGGALDLEFVFLFWLPPVLGSFAGLRRRSRRLLLPRWVLYLVLSFACCCALFRLGKRRRAEGPVRES